MDIAPILIGKQPYGTWFTSKTGGGFDESGWGVNVDSTAHALVSLVPYREQADVKPAIDKALEYLKKPLVSPIVDLADGDL